MLQHLLLVDDEPTMLIAFKKLLQGPEVTVDTAESIEYARGMLNGRLYDAVVADPQTFRFFRGRRTG